MNEKLLKEQNKILKKQLDLLRRNLCKCPKDEDFEVVGHSILCPVHDFGGNFIK